MTEFKDHFSNHAAAYKKYRPNYPPELFKYLSSLVNEHNLAWDCGCGNGQAATGLATHFKNVYATDPSQQQINQAAQHLKITYKVEKAENCSLPGSSVDIITVAQALHWFDLPVFYTEVKRVLKPGGILAAWGCGVAQVNPEIDTVTNHFHNHTLNDYWQAENRIVEKEYSTIPFPFRLIETPAFF
ncbi:MAG TPA: class I SAM-dependent methyltransferase [Flavobacteriales bacterium]|nr:class I SAM-dependent methyltransferase [Flavobacteriales bacterium]